jgi:hypothetical protein
MPRTHRSIVAFALVACVAPAACDPAPAAAKDTSEPRTIEVCPDGCPFTQLAPALAQASDGDTIALAAGTYDGGVVIDASVTLIGAGPDETVIEGGGPVVTIGVYDADGSPTVTIGGVTITGGVTRSWPGAEDQVGDPNAEARGGGVLVAPGAGETLGATVTIRDTVIKGNRVAPSSSVDIGPELDGAPLPYAGATGGGIDNWGNLTLERTTVSGNLVGAAAKLSDPGMASDVQGGGIFSHLGELTIVDSTISENVASATAPNGRWGEGGGIHQEAGSLTITNSVVSGNVARLDAAYPAEVEMMAQPGGLFVGEQVSSATITGTRIVGNRAIMTNSVGDAEAFSGGVNDGADLTMDDSELSGNDVYAATVGRSRGDASADTGGGTLLGTVTDTVVEGNTVTAVSRAGDATAAVGGLLVYGTLAGSRLQGNSIRAVSPRGTASVWGAGLMVAWKPLTLRDTFVTRNIAIARGSAGWVRGGGIFDGPNAWKVPPKPLTLVDSTITDNRLNVVGPLTREGGGIYIDGTRVRSTGTVVTGNSPDDCVGCS